MKIKKADVKRADEVLSGMPCTNRETPAEKAAARKWMQEEAARNRPLNQKTLEQLRKNHESEKKEQ